MEKRKIEANAFVYPMPVVLVGVLVNGKPNFMTVAWVTRVNYMPPRIGVALGKSHYTNTGITTNKTFSVNIPSIDLVEESDYCGLVSGRLKDKSEVFEIFYGTSKNAPMIKQCPLCMECRLFTTLDMEKDTFFVGEIFAAYCEESCMTGGKPDIKKMRPFMLTMPDNQYWEIGDCLGKAWEMGKAYI